MPLLETRGSLAAKGFGFTGGSKEPPGTYTFNNGFSGLSYQPKGWTTVTVTLYGGCGTNNKNLSSFSSYGLGSTVVKTNVPVSSLNIYCPNGVYTSQWSGGGNGGIGATASVNPFNGGYGGAVCAATWSGGTLVAAGGGGNASNQSRTSRQGGIEGTNYGSGGNASSGSNGANGIGSPCYYGGGGGGGGYSVGGYGGSTNQGGNAGGNGATPSPTGTGSYGYSAITVGTSSGLGYATISWGP